MAVRRCFMYQDSCGVVDPDLLVDENKTDFEALITAEEVVPTGVHGTLREVQEACRADGLKVRHLVVKIVEIAISVGTGRKEKAAIKQSSA